MISIIIPVYNGEKYIQRCIDSILNQSFEDFELLVINDGSTDSTGKICDNAAAKEGRIKVIHTENGGVSKARNIGLKKANGEFITFIDGDDYIPANYLSELISAIKEADISLCDVTCINDGVETRRFTCNHGKLNSIDAIELLLSRKEINSGPCAKLFKRSVVGEISFPHMKAYEDILFVLNVFERATYISCTNETEYVYDNSTGGAMTGYAKHPTTDVVTMAEKVFDFLDSNINDYTPNPEYTTFSHLMQHLQSISSIRERTPEQQDLADEIIAFFNKHKSNIRKNSCFSLKEKIVYLFAAKGFWVNKGFKKI